MTAKTRAVLKSQWGDTDPHDQNTDLVDSAAIGSQQSHIADASALTEDSGSIGGTNDGDLPELVATGAVTDDDDAASNGTAVYAHVDEVTEYAAPLAHLESTNAGNADSVFTIGNGGPTVQVKDDDAADTSGLQVYFDEDATNPDERFLINNTQSGVDVFVIASDGKAIRLKHDASASSNGVALYFDDDAANSYERLLFVSPTDADGSYDTDDVVGMVAGIPAIRELAAAINTLTTKLNSVFAALEAFSITASS